MRERSMGPSARPGLDGPQILGNAGQRRAKIFDRGVAQPVGLLGSGQCGDGQHLTPERGPEQRRHGAVRTRL